MTPARGSEPSIVSLIASATEIVCALGLREQLIGISHECDYPPNVKGLPVLSAPKLDPLGAGAEVDRQVRELVRDGLSVYRIAVDELARLRPDLVVTQDHCEVCAVSLSDVSDALCQLTLSDAAVCSLHPASLSDIFDDFGRVAAAAGVPDRGTRLIAEARRRLSALAELTQQMTTRPRVALVEWLEPPMVAGGWMPEIATLAGGEPVIVDSPQHFATVTWNDLVEADPDVIVILPCGYPLEQTRRALSSPDLAGQLHRVPAVRRGECYLADGNAYFNRPGPRITDSAEILAAILHPSHCAPHAERYGHAYEQWGEREI